MKINYRSENYNCWCHHKRAVALQDIVSNFVSNFNENAYIDNNR